MSDSIAFKIHNPYIENDCLNIPLSWQGAEEYDTMELTLSSASDKHSCFLKISHKGIATTIRVYQTFQINLDKNLSESLQTVHITYINKDNPNAKIECIKKIERAFCSIS